MENIKLRNRIGGHVLAVLIPFGLVTISLALLGAAPFGDNTLLMYDAGYQYLDFAAYLKTIFTGENDLLYTFSKNLGGEMVSLLSYYLLSPFNLLFALANLKNLPVVYTLVMVLKVSACGLTFYAASRRQFGHRWHHLIFSTGYALMAYNTMYAWNIMWLDGVLILPLLGLGLQELWQGRSGRLYVFSLAYALLTNFYIGYMLCIASVLFCLALLIVTEGSLLGKAKKCGKFVFASCIGGFSTAFVWMPTFLALLSGRAAYDNTIFSWTPTFNFLGLAGKLVAGTSSVDQLSFGAPHVFCGTAALFLVIAFFLNSKVSLKARGTAMGLILALVASFYFRCLDVVWHGFSPNNAFNYRYAFLLSYVLLMIAQHAMLRREEMAKWCWSVSVTLILGLAAALVAMKSWMGLDFLSLTGIAVSAVTAVIVMVCFLLGLRRGMAILILLVTTLEMGANYYLCMDAVVGVAPTLSLSGYQAYVDKTAPAVEWVKAYDDGFYRMEKTFQRNKNDTMLFSYNGLTHFSSSQKKSILHFQQKMGMTNYRDVWTQYGTGATAEVDSLLGVRYVLSETDLTDVRGYRLLDTVNGIGIYENPSALPVAMLASSGVQTVDMGTGDYFALHNRIWSALTGHEQDLLHPAEAVASLDNLAQEDNGYGVLTYTVIDDTKPAALRYETDITQALPLYFYFTAPEAQSVRVYVNGTDTGAYFNDYRWDISLAGTFAPGDRVTIELRPEGESMVLEDAWFYYEDLAELTQAAEAVRQQPVSLARERSSHLTGTFTAEADQLLLFTIPYDTGWKLYIDGVQAEYSQVLDAFFAAEVSEGEHTFELRFVPQGMIPGGILSTGAVLTALLWTWKTRKRKTQ